MASNRRGNDRLNSTRKWSQMGVTIAGGNGLGSELNQFNYPHGLTISQEDKIIFVADLNNHRIMSWKQGEKRGEVIAGGLGSGNELHQLNSPTDVTVDRQTNSLFVADRNNRRILKWSLRYRQPHGELVVDDISCRGLAMDKKGNLYVADDENHRILRYSSNEPNGTSVAGDHKEGNGLHQFNEPHYLFVDDEDTIYVSDYQNHRIMKWVKGATEGLVVAGGRDEGYDLTQLAYPEGIFVDNEGNIYVAECGHNNRITRWKKKSRKGELLVGGKNAQQLDWPRGISFDHHDHLHVVDSVNQRIQRFDLI